MSFVCYALISKFENENEIIKFYRADLKSSNIYRNVCFLSFSSYKLRSFDFYSFFYTTIIFNSASSTKNVLFMPLHLHIILIKSLKSIYQDEYPFLLIPIICIPSYLV